VRLAAAGLLAAGAMLIGAPAWAQTPPTPTNTVTPAVSSLLQPDPCAKYVAPPEGGESQADAAIRFVNLQQCRQHHPEYTPRHQPVDLAGEMVPGDVGTRFPLQNYDLGFDPGSGTDVSRHFFGTLMTVAWTVNMLFIRFGLFAVTWAFSFTFASKFAAPAAETSRLFTTHLIGPFGFGHIAMAVLALYCGWQLFKGRWSRAGGEVAATLVIWAIFGIIMANPAGYFRGALGLTSDVSGSILQASTDNQAGQTIPAPSNQFDHPEFQASLSPLRRAISTALVDKPYDELDWGQPLTGNCAVIRDAILSQGPWGSDNAPRDAMRADPACAKYADINADPSNGGRWLFAWFFVLLSLGVMILLVIVALAVVGAQLLGIALVATLSIFAALALFPGHKAAWKWTQWAGKAAFTILAASALLVVFVMFFSQGLSITQNDPPAEKAVMVSAVVVGAFFAKKHFFAAATRGSAALAGGLAGAAAGRGGSGGWRPSVPKPGHVLRNLAGVSALGVGTYKVMKEFPDRLDRVKDLATRTAIRVGMPVAGLARGMKDAGRQLTEGVGTAALGAGVPLQNRVAEVRDRLAAAREARLAIPQGALSSYMEGDAFQQSQARQVQQARATKIRAGLADIAARRQREADMEAQRVAQEQARQDFGRQTLERLRHRAAGRNPKP